MNANATYSYDFMVSYTGRDARWAEWIAWQLTTEQYRVSLQAWDMPPGTNFVAAMDRLIRSSQRLVVVMSEDYFKSKFATSEWPPFFKRDPTGAEALILPIRVAPVEPPAGLIGPLAHIDLFDLSAVEAREALLAGARTKRGVPPNEPEFPGNPSAGDGATSSVPPYPGKPASAFPLPRTFHLHVDERGGLRTLVAELTDLVLGRGFSIDDADYLRISLEELVHNATKHVPLGRNVRVVIDEAPAERYNHHESLYVQVIDDGGGFDFEKTLTEQEDELRRSHREHGLLQVLRLVSSLSQDSLEPHTMAIWKERVPKAAPSAFDAERVIPVIFDRKLEAIAIGAKFHTELQFRSYLKRSPEFMAQVFDPILRSSSKFVGIEVRGQSWTGALAWEAVLDHLVTFVKRHRRFGKKLLLFADSSPSDHWRLREYCKQNSIKLFEDPKAVAKFFAGLKPPANGAA